MTKNTYDAEGNLTKVAVDSTGTLNLQTHFAYDALGNLTGDGTHARRSLRRKWVDLSIF